MYTPKFTIDGAKFPNWFSKDLIRLIKEKENYFKKKRNSNDPIFKTLYVAKRLEIKRRKKRDLRDYEMNIESLITCNQKCFFAYTKSLKKSNTLPLVIHSSEKFFDNPLEIANEFAKYFSSVYTEACAYDTLQCNDNCHQYFPLTENIIRDTIHSLDQNKANSPDGIPVVFYRNTMDSIIKPLHFLFTSIASKMKYPTKWKTSFITPIFKSGDQGKIENYRPISIFPAIAKIFDKIVCKHILDRTSHLISPH